MPLRLQTRCRYPGCPATCRGPFCDAHRGTYARRTDERRGTPAQRGYDAAWANVANVRRHHDAFLCQLCLKDGHLTPSKTVDHIIPVHVRPDWRLVLANTQVICPACHQRKTLDDTKRYGSSTQTHLTPEQVEQRRQVQGWNVAPRDIEGEDANYYPSRILTSNSGPGGVGHKSITCNGIPRVPRRARFREIRGWGGAPEIRIFPEDLCVAESQNQLSSAPLKGTPESAL